MGLFQENASSDKIEYNNKNQLILRTAIKSRYIFNIIFSFCEERKKFYIIKYNKKIQKLLHLNIEDYKKISGKYIIGQTNGKGKEYYFHSNELIFEGEYLHGQRKYGKEYKNGEKIFEGLYLNGKRKHGKAYENNQLVYEGEYLFNERNGKGKEYDYDGSLKFEGEYLNGQRWNGKGLIYWNDELIFQREYLNGTEL